jgi:hypothetical protein
MQSKARTVAEYLKELPEDRRQILNAVREVILKNLDPDFEEGMQYGMIGYYVPHRIFPEGYHCDPQQPLPFAGLASQKNHMSLYIMTLYTGSVDESWFAKEWKKTGKKLDMGKCCIRFRKLDDLALKVIAETLRRSPAKSYMDYHRRIREEQTARKRSKKKPTSARKSASKATATAAKKTASEAKASRRISIEVKNVAGRAGEKSATTREKQNK